MRDEVTRYSERIQGDRGNHKLAVSFDLTGSHLGINQYDGDRMDRVLLSPAQVKALIAFVRK